MNTKRCPRCGEMKPTSKYHKDRTSRDGLQRCCGACQLIKNREWAERHPDVARAARKRQPKRPNRKRPPGRQAHRAVEDAIARGDLVRPTVCSRCNRSDSPIQGHHADYARPLDVEWLCARCHMRHHFSDLSPTE